MISVEVTTPKGPVPITKGNQVSFGREPDNDVPIPLPYISRHHAVLERHGSGYRLRDLGGSSGTFLNDRRIASEASIQPGETFWLAGKIAVRLLGDGKPPSNGKSRLVAVSSGIVTIGRDRSNTVSLDSPQVSRVHARAELTERGWLLSDLASTNGTFVNGKAITRGLVTPGDRVTVGPYALRIGRTDIAVEQQTEIRVEAFHLNRYVGAGDKRRCILDDVSLVIEPGEFLAVIGGTGAGKSTLLQALTGIEPASQGEVLVNGISLYRNFDSLRGQFGYVPQQDILHLDLPLGEALDFAAELRMPADTKAGERAHRVEECLGRLGLGSHRATLVGRLSGGERKRASIAMEMLTEPRLLFLDEPTSSLDPKYDKEVMQDLRELARDGHTILLITHRTTNLAGNCQKVAVLARGGKLAYLGPPEQALPYFRRTAEALMKQSPAYREAVARARIDSSQFDDIYSLIEPPRWPDDQMDKLAEYWQQSFRSDPLYEREVTRRFKHQPERAVQPPAAKRNAAQERADAIRQFKILSRRYLSVLWHDKRNLAVLMLQAPILAILLALLYRPADFQPPKADATKGIQFAFFLAAIAVWLGTLNAIREIAKEDSIFRRERLINLKVLPYVASKLAVLIGAGALQVVMLLVLVAVLVQPSGGAAGMIGSFFLLLLAAAAGTASALAVSASVSNQDRAMLAAPLLVIPQIMFAGVFTAVQNWWLVPLIAAARWAYEGVGRVLQVSTLAPDPDAFQQAHGALVGAPVLQFFALLVLFAAFSALACYLQLRKGN